MLYLGYSKLCWHNNILLAKLQHNRKFLGFEHVTEHMLLNNSAESVPSTSCSTSDSANPEIENSIGSSSSDSSESESKSSFVKQESKTVSL